MRTTLPPRRHEGTKENNSLASWKNHSFVVLRAFVSSWSILFLASQASAFPEFQEFVKKNSGRAVNCALCHAHPDGPDGAGPGQLGSLTPEEFIRLNQARSAFEPGKTVHSPILNAFGDRILKGVGKKKFLELKKDPRGLAEALGVQSDLDGDGIPDSREYLDGTHPLKMTDGDPLRLLGVNLRLNWVEILILFLATLLVLYGLNNLLRGFAKVMENGDEED